MKIKNGQEWLMHTRVTGKEGIKPPSRLRYTTKCIIKLTSFRSKLQVSSSVWLFRLTLSLPPARLPTHRSPPCCTMYPDVHHTDIGWGEVEGQEGWRGSPLQVRLVPLRLECRSPASVRSLKSLWRWWADPGQPWEQRGQRRGTPRHRTMMSRLQDDGHSHVADKGDVNLGLMPKLPKKLNMILP